MMIDQPAAVQWSVGIEVAGGDGAEVMSLEAIGELADAVAPDGGIASGIGQTCYGVKVLVEAESRESAVARATEILRAAARTASLPEWPVSRVEVVSEEEEDS
jgi:hypothetical protein